MVIDLQSALQDPIWINHKIGDQYSMSNVGSSKMDSGWKLSYYPLFGTYKDNKWIEFDSPRALIEKPMTNGGIDFREVPLYYLTKQQI
jgi:hypothetical protein